MPKKSHKTTPKTASKLIEDREPMDTDRSPSETVSSTPVCLTPSHSAPGTPTKVSRLRRAESTDLSTLLTVISDLKPDLSRKIDESTADLRTDLRQEINRSNADLRSELREEIALSTAGLRQEMLESNSDIRNDFK